MAVSGSITADRFTMRAPYQQRLGVDGFYRFTGSLLEDSGGGNAVLTVNIGTTLVGDVFTMYRFRSVDLRYAAAVADQEAIVTVAGPGLLGEIDEVHRMLAQTETITNVTLSPFFTKTERAPLGVALWDMGWLFNWSSGAQRRLTLRIEKENANVGTILIDGLVWYRDSRSGRTPAQWDI